MISSDQRRRQRDKYVSRGCEKIDSISIPNDNRNTVSLGISDHLTWDDSIGEHLYKLQEKINAYIDFIESGEIYEAFPASKDTELKIIDIYFKYDPAGEAISFLEQVSNVLQSINIELSYQTLKLQKSQPLAVGIFTLSLSSYPASGRHSGAIPV
ncbi:MULTISPECIES: DUF6572 domain-containing protein [Enterobacteriaceae]|uniref:DUF6572 domain-containing protein n=1 Tax=Enterobacteriaceae TaxID=543 RepID=UPI0012F4B926|nr:DUF6572 domain-containing protein [Enterobacter sp. Ag1]